MTMSRMLGVCGGFLAVVLVLGASQAFANSTFKGLSSSEYQSMFNAYVSANHIPVALKGYVKNGEARYDVTFAPNTSGRAFIARHGIGNQQLESQMQSAVNKGFYLSIHSAFYVKGVLTHAAVWVK